MVAMISKTILRFVFSLRNQSLLYLETWCSSSFPRTMLKMHGYYFCPFFPFQIDAHIGNVSDLAFSHPNKQLALITCGEDKTIKVCIVCFVYIWLMSLHCSYQSMFACRSGMLPLVLSCIHLRVMKHLSILYALIIKKIFRYLVLGSFGILRVSDFAKLM